MPNFHEIFWPFDNFYSSKGGGSTRGSVGSVSGGTKQQQVSAYLASHPEFLESYVMNNVDMETMERWTIRKARQFNNKGGKNSYFLHWRGGKKILKLYSFDLKINNILY